MEQKTKKLGRATLLILLCWLVYTSSYIGKLSYNANMQQIGLYYGVSYSQTGIVATFFFFAYGAGQIFSGMFCKRYNIKYVIAGSLLVASLMNVLAVNMPSFGAIKYLWLIDGFAMSFLWATLIRLLSETLQEKDINRAVMIMGTTTSVGTFISYGLCAGLAVFGAFRWTFYIAAIVLTGVALLWFVSFDRLVTPLREAVKEETKTASTPSVAAGRKKKGGLLPLLCVLAVFAVVNNLVREGLISWTPDILAALYHTPGWMSILLTLLLPLLSVGGVLVSVNLFKRLNNFIAACTVLFMVATVFVAAVLGLLSTALIPVIVGCLALVSCMMAGVNNVITSITPLRLKEYGDSGKLAGLLNGFCYVGSTLSTYGLGLVADNWGWKSVFVLLLGASFGVTLLGGGTLLVKRLRKG